MFIKIRDKWLLESGKRDFIVSEIKVPTEGKNKGVEIYIDSSYFRDIRHALKNVLTREILKSEATTLTGLLIEIQTLRNEFKELFDLNV